MSGYIEMLQKRARHWGACCTAEVCSAIKTTRGAAHRAVRIAHRSANHLDQHRRGLARTPARHLQRSELEFVLRARASGRSGCIGSSRARPTHCPKTGIGSDLQQTNVRKTTGCIEQPHIGTALGTRKQSKDQKNVARNACHGVALLFASSVKKLLVARSREALQCHASAYAMPARAAHRAACRLMTPHLLAWTAFRHAFNLASLMGTAPAAQQTLAALSAARSWQQGSPDETNTSPQNNHPNADRLCIALSRLTGLFRGRGKGKVCRPTPIPIPACSAQNNGTKSTTPPSKSAQIAHVARNACA
jgi:hypothetical protein